jgi:predicted MFS family arabinose efflux permease
VTREGVHHAWIVAGVASLAMLAASAAAGVASILMLPLQREFGWDIGAVSSAVSVRWLLFGVAGLLAAPLVDACGLRRVVLSALALIAAGLLASLAMTRTWHVILLWGVFVGVGSGLLSVTLGMMVATRWFSERRGLVIGALGGAATMGQLIMLPPLAALVETCGWRGCILAICGLVVLAAAAVSALVPERPEDIGLRPFGTRANPASAAGPVPLRDMASTFHETARSGVFWSLFGTFAVCGASTGGLIQAHLVPLCADYAVVPGQATGVLALIGLLAFAGTSISGWLSDRFDAGWLLFWFYGLRGLSLVALSFSEISFAGLSLFALLYGLDWTATVPPTARLVVARFGPQRAGLVFGWVFTGHQLGGAVAAFGAGAARIGLGSYLPALLVTGSLCLMASAAILSLSTRLAPTAAEANDGP